ncbi:hypothetical protein [Mesorhizobium sp. ORS 3428]|uniref:hypothetical protein n=1 Tax=Mesorhizobium sp. ORS 3428 TaxID=540997 RepID=UPI0008D92D86|nr:hypothetical protein [Mesorhizobium sp. ORS 3428]OHV86671.1 hypothetical protein ORS3428_22850 [Mesorhizobium sp. ORS 3428]
MSQQEIVNIGLSEAGNDKLDDLKENGIFAEKMDGYRFAVALALAQGAIAPEIGKRSTFLNVGSLDPDQTLRRAVETLMPEQLTETTPYRLIERLADWGVNDLHAQAKSGGIDFVRLFDQVAEKAV